jgi:hypothetical protein
VGPREPLRLTEILTTSSAIANFLGEPTIRASHLLRAIQILQGELTIEDLGRPVSPLVPRGRDSGGVEPNVQDLVQRWFAVLGSDAKAELSESQLAEFVDALRSIDVDPAR